MYQSSLCDYSDNWRVQLNDCSCKEETATEGKTQTKWIIFKNSKLKIDN